MDSEPLRVTQLRAQSRIYTGFPIKFAGKITGQNTIIRCKVTKKVSLGQYMGGVLVKNSDLYKNINKLNNGCSFCRRIGIRLS